MFDSQICETACDTQLVSSKEPTLLERLQDKRVYAAAKLADIDAAIAALTANPDLEKALTAVSRSMRY